MTRRRQPSSLLPASWSQWARHLGSFGQSSLSDSTAVLRLVAACQATGTEPASLLEAWGQEVGIRQRTRLHRLAEYLRTQHSLEVAITKVPGVVRADHGFAIGFGSQLNILGATLANCLSRSARLFPDDGRRRFLLGYLCVILLLFLPVHMLISLRILPQYAKIYADFGTELPAITTLGISAMTSLSQAFLWAAAPVLAVVLLWTSSLRVRRRLQSVFAGRDSRAFALDLLSTALAAGVSFRTAATTLSSVHWNPSLRRRLAAACDRSPGEQLVAARLIPPDAVGFIDEAIASNRGSQALQQLADQLRAKHQLARNCRTELLAPALAAAMGLIVGIELLAVFTPLVKLIEGLS